MILCGRPIVSVAQTGGPFTIRVEAKEVTVPVFVIDNSDIRETHLYGGGSTFDEFDKEITGLTSKDFQVFEDDKQQTIQKLSIKEWTIQSRDEFSPRGIWSRQDSSFQTPPGNDAFSSHAYLLSYIPPPAPDGSCHRIVVKVKSRHATVFAPEEYCTTKFPTADPMYGTKLGKQMESFANLDSRGKLPLSVQVGSFRVKPDSSRVDITVEFPSSAVKRVWHNTNLVVTIAVLGMVYDKEKTLAARFSDSWNTLPVDFYRGQLPPQMDLLRQVAAAAIPSRYERQLNLAPGRYDLIIVVSDGDKLGRVASPLTLESYDPNRLSISDILLCKHFRKMSDEPRSLAEAPQYVPLTSNGLEFSPTGNPRFAKGERLMSYFEIYVPPPGRDGIQKMLLQMKVTDAKTGNLKSDTGVRLVDSKAEPGNPTISLAREIAVDKLTPGSYRLEVQVSDSAGNKTEWRSASFTVE